MFINKAYSKKEGSFLHIHSLIKRRSFIKRDFDTLKKWALNDNLENNIRMKQSNLIQSDITKQNKQMYYLIAKFY